MPGRNCRAAALLLLVLSAGACGGSNTPAATPTQPSTPAPTRWSISGTILESGSGTVASSAKVEVLDGANQGKSAPADGSGRYRLDDLEAGTFSLRASASGFDVSTRSVTLTSNLVVDFALARSKDTPPPGSGVTGTTVDGLSGQPLGGVRVRVDGVGETTTAADGTFQLAAADPQQVRATVLSSASTYDRTTRLKVPGPLATLSLVPGSLDMRAFDEMFRGSGGVLHRWTTPPRVVFQRRVLQFTNVTAVSYVALEGLMTETEVNGMAADLAWALPQLTGNTFTGFAEQLRETAAVGESVPYSRPGYIVVTRVEGLTSALGFWGYSRWAWNAAGEMQAGFVMIDRVFDTSGSAYVRSLRTHEFGHALGYTHVTVRESVMNSAARLEPNGFDLDAARIAFQRTPLSRSPDIDPDPFTGNLRSLRELFWTGMR